MPNNFDTRIGPGGGAQMYVNGQWLDENLFSPGTGLAGPLSPKQEANAGYAPGSAQTSRNPYLGETPDPGSNLYEPWRTPTIAPTTTGVAGAPNAIPPTPKIDNTGVAAVKPDGYGDLANMYGQKAKQAANAGYTGVAKTVTGAQGSALAAASAGGAMQNQQTSRVLAQTKTPTVQLQNLNRPPIAAPGNTAAIPPAPVSGQPRINTTNLGGSQREGERTNGGDSWVYMGDGVWFNTATGQQTNTPPPGVADNNALLDQRKNEQNPNIPQDAGSPWTFIGGRQWLNIYTGEVTTDPKHFESPGTPAGNIVQQSTGARPSRDFGDFGIAEMVLGYPVKAGWVETSPGVWEKDSPTAQKVLAEADVQKTESDRLSALAGIYERGNESTSLDQLGPTVKPLPDRVRPTVTETLGDGKTQVTSDPLADVANAARSTALAMGASMADNLPSWMGKAPNVITERIAEELDWKAQGYASAADMLEQLGYVQDPNNPGLWIWPTNTGVVGGGGQASQGYYNPYGGSKYGGGGWSDYGYGYGGRSYGSGGGGGGGGYGGGMSYGLINWRIG